MPDGVELTRRLRASLVEQERMLRRSLILNPVENVPFPEDLSAVSGGLHGLYNTDKVRAREARMDTPMQFAGRAALESDSRAIYAAWSEALGASDATLRLLSGLHAHIVLFMAMARPGQTVLLLPIEAGGHVSGPAILERLGLTVIEMVVDESELRVDIPRTLALCKKKLPDFLLVDRSEGLVYEDFEALAGAATTTIFDASQYLSNIISGDHPNPLGWGFDLLIASVHKNFPGPQKALLATREDNAIWRKILSGVSVYVSNMHVASSYAAGLTLARTDWLSSYSRDMLDVAVALEEALAAFGVPVVRRPPGLLPTHHLWIRESSRGEAFETYERLEQCLIMTNFRLLPYGLGYGLRLGVSAAVRIGMSTEDVPRLAELIAQIRREGATTRLKREASSFSQSVWSKGSLG